MPREGADCSPDRHLQRTSTHERPGEAARAGRGTADPREAQFSLWESECYIKYFINTPVQPGSFGLFSSSFHRLYDFLTEPAMNSLFLIFVLPEQFISSLNETPNRQKKQPTPVPTSQKQGFSPL